MTRFNPRKLYKDPGQGRIMGVCSGVADYLDVSAGLVRFATILAVLFTWLWGGIFVYIALGLMLDPKPADVY